MPSDLMPQPKRKPKPQYKAAQVRAASRVVKVLVVGSTALFWLFVLYILFWRK